MVAELRQPVEETEDKAAIKTIVCTIGHSNHPIDKFLGLLKQHGITAVGDVRSVPYSRFNPQFNKNDFAASLKKAGIAYVFLGQVLGARPDDRSCYENGQVDFSRMAGRADFTQGLDRVIRGSGKYRIALMCAEKEPLDCHRTILVCRNLKAHGVHIRHILADGTVEDHDRTEGRLLRITDCERSLLDQGSSDSELLERAYAKRGRQIAHKAGHGKDATQLSPPRRGTSRPASPMIHATTAQIMSCRSSRRWFGSTGGITMVIR